MRFKNHDILNPGVNYDRTITIRNSRPLPVCCAGKGGLTFMPGKNLIRIPSIFLAIEGLISIIVYLIFGLILSYGTIDTGEKMGWLVVAVDMIYTILALLQFIAAAKGIKNCDRPDAASELKERGIRLIMMALIAGALNLGYLIQQNGSLFSALISIFCSLIFPILYTYGAFLNENA